MDPRQQVLVFRNERVLINKKSNSLTCLVAVFLRPRQLSEVTCLIAESQQTASQAVLIDNGIGVFLRETFAKWQFPLRELERVCKVAVIALRYTQVAKDVCLRDTVGGPHARGNLPRIQPLASRQADLGRRDRPRHTIVTACFGASGADPVGAPEGCAGALMSTHRETYFTCTYASQETRKTAVVAAWDARMAESLFRELLEEESLDGGGVIEIERPGGRVAHRAPFARDS